MEIKTLIEEIAHGPDKEYSCNVLYKRLNGQMMTLCYNYIGNWEDAEELMNEVFVDFFKYKVKKVVFESDAHAVEYIRSMMRNASISLFKANKRTPDMLNIVGFEDDFHDSAEILHKLDVIEIYALIDKLPQTLKRIFTMHTFECLSHAEIGCLLNISEETSYSQLSRAKAILRKLLTEKKWLYEKN